MLGTTNEELVLIAQATGVIHDLTENFNQEVLFCSKDKFGVDGKEQFYSKVIPSLKKLDAFLAGRTYAAGPNLTFIDFSLFEVKDMIRCFD
jgi:glutathione S-transferase